MVKRLRLFSKFLIFCAVFFCLHANAQINFFECAKNPEKCKSPAQLRSGDGSTPAPGSNSEPHNGVLDSLLKEKEDLRLRLERLSKLVDAERAGFAAERQELESRVAEIERRSESRHGVQDSLLKEKEELRLRLEGLSKLVDKERAGFAAERQQLESRVAEIERRERELAQQSARSDESLAIEKLKRHELEGKLAEERRARENLKSSSVPRPQPSSRIERRVALVIGNSNYKVGPLSNPVNDASDMAEALKATGFEVFLVQNATIARVREVTRKFAEVITSSDVALIFYAGHGLESRGKNYIIPVDANIKHEYELEDQAYDAGRWLDMLEDSRSSNKHRVNIVILDACRDNAFSRGGRTASRGLTRMDAPAGTFLAFATAPGKVALDGDKQRNSPFTRSLLKAVEQPNLPIELVFKEVRRMVLEETNGEQVPWDNSSLVGDFFFRR